MTRREKIRDLAMAAATIATLAILSVTITHMMMTAWLSAAPHNYHALQACYDKGC